MVYLTALWLPIVLAAVVVFLASFILHMVIPHHRNDHRKLPNEEAVLEAMRKEGVSPGNYYFPRPAGPKDMKSPEMMEKYEKGPVGIMNILPSGPPAMGKSLVLWFVYCLVLGVFVAYITGRTLGPGAEYLAVFRVAGATGFLGYALGHLHESIWKGQYWSTTFKFLIDGLIYALVSAGVFAWLWP